VRDELLKDDIESGFNTGLHLKYKHSCDIYTSIRTRDDKT
jgi:hypothetical protein